MDRRVIGGVALLVVAVAVVYAISSLSPSTVVVPTSTPTRQPSTAPSATAVPTASVAVSPSATVGASATVVTTFPLGRLHGQIAWVSRMLPSGSAPASTVRPLVTYELWAIPLDGSTPRVAVRYRSAFTARFLFSPRDTNVLRRQLSPDGRRVVLSVATSDDGTSQELRVIDLETGVVAIPLHNAFPTATNLDVNPAWSPDGALIAFVRMSATGAGGELWVSSPDGGAAKALWRGCNDCQPSSPLIHRAVAPPRIWGWLPDSQHIGFDPVNFEQSAFAVIDLNGLATDLAPFYVGSADPASWRSGSPAFAVGTGGGNPPVRTEILVSDGPEQRSPQIVADVTVNPNDNTVTGVRDPRWDPTGGRVLIYVESGVQGSFVIADLDARTTKKVGGRVAYADWLPTGEAIVTLEEHPSTAPLSVYVWERDGHLRTSGLFLSPTDTNYVLTDLAARAYQP